MAEHVNLADTLRPFIQDMEESEKRPHMEDLVNLMDDFSIVIIPAEFANKGVPTIRKATREGSSFVIANRGKLKSLKEAEIIMTVDLLIGLMGRVYDGVERQATRRPADAILQQLEPTSHPDLVNMSISKRKHEETTGGRRRLY